MGLIELIVVLVVVGVVLYCINRWVPMDEKIKKILNIAVVIGVVLFLIGVFLPGLFGGLRDIPVSQ